MDTNTPTTPTPAKHQSNDNLKLVESVIKQTNELTRNCLYSTEVLKAQIQICKTMISVLAEMTRYLQTININNVLTKISKRKHDSTTEALENPIKKLRKCSK
jgi:hypothetical protein